MNVAVLIPFRPSTGRDENLCTTLKQWRGWPTFFGDGDEGLFNRAQAINRAAARTDADVFVIHDCDILLARHQQAVDAAMIALSEDSYVVCFSTLKVFDWTATYAVHNGKNPLEQPVLETVKMVWGNCFAISRTLFERVGGFDERFKGWGAEDHAFLNACSTLGNKHRVVGDAFHLRHPEPVKDHPSLHDNYVLGGRYAKADGNREAMLALIGER